MSPRTITALLLSLLLALAAACSDDPALPAEGPGEAQAGVSGELISGSLSDVPVPNAAEASGPLVDEEGRQTQSYIVTAETTTSIQDYYADELPALGWEQESRDERTDFSRSVWTDGDRRLIVAAIDQDQNIDLNLQVTDADVPPPNIEEGDFAPTEAAS